MDTTILIPARIRTEQELEWLKEAVNSALGQGKILVGYNNSTHQKLPKFAKKATVLNLDARNLAAARNQLTQRVKSPYFFFLDADDILPENAIAQMEDFIKTVPEKRYVYGDTLLFGKNRLEVPARDFDCEALTKGVYFPNGVLQPIQNLTLVGPWDEQLDVLEDKDWWLTAAEKEVIGVPLKGVTTYHYRQREDGLVLSARNTPLWQQSEQHIREKHAAFYRGEYPMCCGKEPISTSVSSAAPLPLIAGEGTILVHYTQSTANVNYWGPVTGKMYTVSANRPDVLIDEADAITNNRTKPGLLELTRNNHFIFERK